MLRKDKNNVKNRNKIIWVSRSVDYEEFYLLERHVVRWESSDVLEEHVASIFRVEE
jgi:hypothetical protein